MAKLPYMQFYPADWILDTQVLTLDAKGAWIDILCQLWISETPGIHTWNMREFTTLLRLSYDKEIEQMVADLSRVAEVTLTNDDDREVKHAVDCTWITIKSRRIVRDWESLRARKETHKRYNDKRTTHKRQHNDTKTTDRSQKSEVRNQNQKSEEELREENTPPPPTRRAGVGKVAFPPDWKPDPEEMQQWKQHGINPFVEFATFRDHALANDRRCKDWKAAFRNWCRKAISLKEQKSWPVPGAGSIRASA